MNRKKQSGRRKADLRRKKVARDRNRVRKIPSRGRRVSAEQNQQLEEPPQWTPLELCQECSEVEARAAVEKEAALAADGQGWTSEQIEHAIKDMLSCTIYKNHMYQVAYYPPSDRKEDPASGEGWPETIHLSIKRIDRQPVHDWAHLQRIKNELVGESNEAIELYPAEGRVVNMANQYHLWVFADPEIRIPIGFHDGRHVSDDIAESKARQRLFETSTSAGEVDE